MYPLDLIKTRMQVAPERFPTAFAAATAALKDGGVPALYAGMGAQLVGVAPEKSLKLLAYTACHAGLLEALAVPHGVDLPFGWEALAGAAAGCAQSLVACPLEAMKIPLQLAEGGAPRRSVAAVAAELGPAGLFRGLGVCFARDAATGALFFSCFAAAKHVLRQHGLPPFVLKLVAGALAGAPAALLTTPLDVVKTRMQAPGAEAAEGGAVDAFRGALADGGPGALWVGAGERVARLSPSLGITLAIYEWLDDLD